MCEERFVPNEQPKIIEGELLARDLRFAFVAARFNDLVVDPLIRGALDALKRHGAGDKQIEIVRVPGAFDIPIVARKLALSHRYDALITLGAVVRGQTPHFDYVAGECASGIARIALGRAHLVRRPDDRHDGTGDGSRGRQGRQQGCGCRARRDRNGEFAASVGYVKSS
jgi:6,7-dimethyl-8-ribityllumazine synthase